MFDDAIGNDDDSTEQKSPPTNRTDTIHPTLIKILTVSGKFLWIAARTIVTGLLIGVAILTSKKRRIHVRQWFLLKGNRWVIAGGLVGGVFFITFVLSLADVIGVKEPRFVTAVFSSIISGMFSFVPIVIAVNQLTVANMVDTPGGLRDRIENITKFRMEIEDLIPEVSVSPTEPARFLAILANTLDQRTTALQQAGTDYDPQIVDRINEYTDRIEHQVEAIDEGLNETNPRLMEVLLPLMGQGYSANINTARQIQESCADTLTDTDDELLDDIRELFVSMDVVRQYFKALYVKQELSLVSRLIAYTGISAFLSSSFLILLFANGQPLPGHPFVVDGLVGFTFAAAFSPFAVLLAFMIRIATIAKRTAAPGAFTPRRETPDYLRRN